LFFALPTFYYNSKNKNRTYFFRKNMMNLLIFFIWAIFFEKCLEETEEKSYNKQYNDFFMKGFSDLWISKNFGDVTRAKS
jgi:hypothetical protein